MKHKQSAVLLLAMVISGCASQGAVNSRGDKVDNIISVLKQGDIRLTCGTACSGAWGLKRREEKNFYDNQLWEDLAITVSGVGFGSDQSYYYLGRAAEEFGHLDAALTYYRLSYTVHKCDGVFNNCDGLDIPKLVQTRINTINTIQTKAVNKSRMNADALQAIQNKAAIDSVPQNNVINKQTTVASAPVQEIKAEQATYANGTVNKFINKKTEDRKTKTEAAEVAKNKAEEEEGAKRRDEARKKAEARKVEEAKRDEVSKISQIATTKITENTFDSISGYTLGQSCDGSPFLEVESDVSNPDDVSDKIAVKRKQITKQIDENLLLIVKCDIIKRMVYSVSLTSKKLDKIIELGKVLEEKMQRPADDIDKKSERPGKILGKTYPGFAYESKKWVQPNSTTVQALSSRFIPYGSSSLDDLKWSGGIELRKKNVTEDEWYYLRNAGTVSSKETEEKAKERSANKIRDLLQ